MLWIPQGESATPANGRLWRHHFRQWRYRFGLRLSKNAQKSLLLR